MTSALQMSIIRCCY